MKAHLELFIAAVKIKPEGKRKRTIMLAIPLAKELADLAAAANEKELVALAVRIWDGAVKSSLGLYWYPPETNPDIPKAELLD